MKDNREEEERHTEGRDRKLEGVCSHSLYLSSVVSIGVRKGCSA